MFEKDAMPWQRYDSWDMFTQVYLLKFFALSEAPQ